MFDSSLPTISFEESYHIAKSKNDWSIPSGYDLVLERLTSEPMKTYFTDINWFMIDNDISQAINGKSDWSELEHSINIYLSE